MSFSLAITSLSSLARASVVSVAWLNSNSSVEARFTIAGFFGSGFATGAGAGAGSARGGGAGSGLGAFCVAHAASSAALAKAATKKEVLTVMEILLFLSFAVHPI